AHVYTSHCFHLPQCLCPAQYIHSITLSLIVTDYKILSHCCQMKSYGVFSTLIIAGILNRLSSVKYSGVLSSSGTSSNAASACSGQSFFFISEEHTSELQSLY